ncbi:YncE family protein [Geobacter sp. DSM 9736]|uniref:YncE family protein n=1 Tax=Geobacter sp. DSM 9736 TaxID=1277350 RepID=UPI000B60886A|nr:hypothetical protein [Geobacter sp. DSM 9736]SNB47144.1 40-residue YVTN family beta-propeller repeat-containing protein [Geobacter sp. DSM 9736]
MTKTSAEKRMPGMAGVVRMLAAGIAVIMVAGCAGSTGTIRKPFSDPQSGALYLYMEPLPQDADRITFSLAGISAVKADGVEVPLALRMSELQGGAVRRQRLLAVGELPAGEYSGFIFKIAKAHLHNEDGDAALLLPEKPARKELAFQVEKREATVVSAVLKGRESLKGGIGFDPVFSLSIPENPLPSVTGYVSNEGSDTVTVFDKRAARVARVIGTGRAPAGIAIDQLQRKAYVAVSGDDAVEVIDTNTNEVISRIRLHPGDAPREIALASDGRILITVNSGSNTVSFLDPLSQTEAARVNVGNRPSTLVMDREGRKIYVFNTLSNSISVIDVATRLVSATIPTESGPMRGQFNRKGDRLVVSHSMSPYLLVINPASFSAEKRVYAGMGIAALKINPSTDFIYAGYRIGGKTEIFDSYSYIPVDSIPAEEGISYLTIDGDENNLVGVRLGSATVQLVNLVSKKVVGQIDVGEEPYLAALFGEK